MQRREFIAMAGAAVSPLGSPETAFAAPADTSVRPRPLVFPADFGAHPATRTEWWYATGWLQAQDAASAGNATVQGAAPALYGFQVTFFRSATGLPASPSRFAAQQLVFAHAVVGDVAGRRQRHDQRIARAGFGIADAAEGDTGVLLRDWSLRRAGAADASRYTTRVASERGGFAFELAFAATQPVLLQGEAGFSRKGPKPFQASHYYSEPQLRASGTLTLDGKPLAVQGRAWFDHEWSDHALADDAVGWDWIGINLDDGSALTAVRHRRADGTQFYAGGSFRAAGGPVRNFGPDEVRFVAGRRWASPASQASYPVEWAVETPAGRYRVRALFDEQELDSRGSTGGFYWEGLSEVRDESGRRVGLGYLEMTGYAGRLRT